VSEGFWLLRDCLKEGEVTPADCAATGPRNEPNTTWPGAEYGVPAQLARGMAQDLVGARPLKVGPTVIHRAANDPPRGWHRDWPFWNNAHALDEMPPQLGVLFYPIGGTIALIPNAHLRWCEIDDELIAAVGRCAPQVPMVEYRELESEKRVYIGPRDVLLLDGRLPHAVPADPRDRPAMNVWCWFFDHLNEPMNRDHSILRGR